MGDQQTELAYDSQPIWHRAVRESGRAYLAFQTYRDLGPQRSLLAAYKLVRRRLAESGQDDGDPALDLELREADWKAPASWYIWRARWQWESRVEAFDQWRDDQSNRDIERIRLERMRQQLEIDAEVHFPQIVAINRRIDELLAMPQGGGFARTTQDDHKGKVNTLDRAKAFELLTAERRELESAYFGVSRPLWAGKSMAACKEGTEGGGAMVGRFEWVRDPEVPEAAPPPSEAPAPDLDPSTPFD